ncbi:MAG: MFS transporter [Lachnospiraceae bacterium]|nr:MFS transporter [Lachnospiraceae bacterium]
MNTYTKKERNMYLIGLMGQNVIYNIIATGMVFYFQSVIFIPAIAISVIMGIARIWDAVNDPMMGTVVDRTRTKWGKCRPYLFFVPGIVMITTFLTFINGQYSNANSPTKNAMIIGWAAVSYIVWGMTYTAGDIPIWGITSLMTESEKDRASILSLARIVAGIAGALILLMIVPISQSVGGSFTAGGMSQSKGLQMGFIVVCGIFTLVGSLMFQCAAFAKERVEQPSDEHKGFVDNVKIMWACKPFRRILISGVLKAPLQLLLGIAMTLMSYYYGDNGGDGQSYMLYMAILGGAMFGSQFIAMGFVPKLCEKFEKRSVYNVSTAIGVIPFTSIFVMFLLDGTGLYKTHWVIFTAIMFAFAGAGIGASTVMQSILIADCVDFDEHRTGYRPDGIFFSGQSFITKLGAGLSSFIQGIVFAIVGFSGDAVAACNEALASSPASDFMFATAPEFEKYRFGMFFLLSIPTAISCIIAILPMLKYEISNKKHKEIMQELTARRNK